MISKHWQYPVSAFVTLADALQELAGRFATTGLKIEDPLMIHQAAALRELATRYRSLPDDHSLTEAQRKAEAAKLADDLMEILSRNPTELAQALIIEHFQRLHAALRPATAV